MYVETSEQKAAGTQPRLDSITIQWTPDESPDLSYLEQFDADSSDQEERGYAREDARRLETYGESWWMYGCTAKAEVSYSIGGGNRRIERLSSGGLWGIESDSGREYLESVAREQIEDLSAHLQAFGVDVSNLAELAAAADLARGI